MNGFAVEMLTLLLAIGTPQAETSPAPTPAVSIRDCLTETEHNFGEVPHGLVCNHRFLLRNRTRRPIHLVLLKSNCVCVSASHDKETVAVGEEMVIQVRFDARKFTGERDMTVEATFDQPYIEKIAFRIRGYSRKDIIVDPGELDLGEVRHKNGKRVDTRVEYFGELDWQIDSISAPAELEATVNQTKRGDNRVEYRVEVGVRPDARLGQVQGVVILRTNDPKTPVVSIPVRARIVGPVVASEEDIFFDRLRVGQSASRRILLSAEEPFEIISTSKLVDGLTVSSTTGSQLRHVLEVKLDPKSAGTVKEQIRLATSIAPDAPLEIRVEAIVEPK